MAQVAKFTEETLREFILKFIEDNGKRPTISAAREHFGGGNISRLGSMMNAIFDNIDQEEAEKAKLPQMPDKVAQLAAKMAENLWQEAIQTSSVTIRALERAIEEKSKESEDLRSKLSKRIEELTLELDELATKNSEAEKATAEAKAAAAKAEKERSKLEAQLEAQGKSLSKAEKRTDALQEQVTKLTADLAVAKAGAK